MKLIYLFTLAGILTVITGCSPSWYLQQAERKGAKIASDTVFKDVITERTITDTITHFQTVDRIMAGDTITLETVRWRSKTVIDTLTKTVYQQVECKPDTLRIPVTVTQTISAGYSENQVRLMGLVLTVLLLAVVYTVGKVTKRI